MEKRVKPTRIQGFLLYRIYYGDNLVYIVRIKQPLENRLRGHFLAKPMQRTIAIELVTKIQYASFRTEADMNLYEIYYILRLKPPLNVDDKTRDNLTVSLPEVEWHDWYDPIMERWKEEIVEKASTYEKNVRRARQSTEDMRVVRSLHKTGAISDEDYEERMDRLRDERAELEKLLHRHVLP